MLSSQVSPHGHRHGAVVVVRVGQSAGAKATLGATSAGEKSGVPIRNPFTNLGVHLWTSFFFNLFQKYFFKSKSSESTSILQENTSSTSKKKTNISANLLAAPPPPVPGREGWVSCWCGCSQTGHAAAPAHPPSHRPGSLWESYGSCGTGRQSHHLERERFRKCEVFEVNIQTETWDELGFSWTKIWDVTSSLLGDVKPSQKCLHENVEATTQQATPPTYLELWSRKFHTCCSGYRPRCAVGLSRVRAGLNIVNCRVCGRDLKPKLSQETGASTCQHLELSKPYLKPCLNGWSGFHMFFSCHRLLPPIWSGTINHASSSCFSLRSGINPGLPHCCWLHKQRKGTLGHVQYPDTKASEVENGPFSNRSFTYWKWW